MTSYRPDNPVPASVPEFAHETRKDVVVLVSVEVAVAPVGPVPSIAKLVDDDTRFPALS
jgi:hypothetical protein